MAKNENLPSSLHGVLRKIYPTDSMEGLHRLIPKWTAKGFGLDLLNVGCSIEGDERPSTCDSWIETSCPDLNASSESYCKSKQ